MDMSINVPTKQVTTLKAGPTVSGPSEPNCRMQVAHIHRLKQSEENYDQHRLNLSMEILRKNEGLAAPLKMNMELFAARQVGRLPFLQSSHAMEDALLGNDELIQFSDFLGLPENHEYMRQPHMVVERSLGIL